jgi:hypothetical protein
MTATQIQFRRGTASQIATFTGAVGEVVVDTTNNRVVVQDGTTAGGWPAAKLSEVGALGSANTWAGLQIFDDGIDTDWLNIGSATFGITGIAPLGNTYQTDSALVVQATPAVGSDANRRFLVTFGLEPGGTAGSGGNEGNVTLYCGMDAGENSAVTYGDVWAVNFLTTFGPHYNGGGGYVAELDLNNNTGTDFPSAPQVGLTVNSGGSNKPTTAYDAGSSSASNAWNTAFQATTYIAGYAFLDSSSGAAHSFYSIGTHTDGLNLAGTYTYGIDGNSGTFSTYFLRGPSAKFTVDGSGNVEANNLSIASGKTLAVSNTLTFGGTDGKTHTFPNNSGTVAELNLAQTWSALQTFNAGATFSSGSVTMPDSATWATTGIGSLVALGVGEAVPSAGLINVSSGYGIAGAVVLSLAGGGVYTSFNNPAGGNSLLLGDATDPTNYFNNTTQNFRTTAGTTYATLSASLLALLKTTAIPAGGAADTGIELSSTAHFGIFFGSGAPTLSAGQGSIYLRSDGSSGSTRIYVNTNSSTGWTNVTTAS